MHLRSFRSIERRDFLRWGAALGALGALVGCSAEGEGTVAPPPTASNKKRLDMLQGKADKALEKVPTKKK
jgi:TAT (twin-arginine translocation) pathway signal sequence